MVNRYLNQMVSKKLVIWKKEVYLHYLTGCLENILLAGIK
jgi:hypothetical protein